MGLFDLVKFPIKRKLAKLNYEITEYELARKQIEEATNIINKSKIDTDEDQWALIGTGKKLLTQEDYATIRAQVWRFWKTSPHARAILRCLVKFVIGKGIVIQAYDESEIVQKTWDEFQRKNIPHSKQKEIVRRLLRDGEIFLRFFVNTETGDMKFRFIDPEYIQDPSGTHTFGIETDADDIENVKKYYRINTEGTLAETIDAKEVDHYKALCDSDEKRGRSVLEIVLPMIKKYVDWLNDRIILNKVRTAIVLIKKITGVPAQIAAKVSARESAISDYSQYKEKTLRPGTIITASPGVDYKFENPNIDARDVKDDGRAILLTLVAGSGLAEYMVTGDASNQNYASTMIAESPAVREFEDWQSECVEIFQNMFERVIKAAIKYGKIPEMSRHTEYYTDKVTGKQVKVKVRVPTSILCDVNFPPMIHRELKDETVALVIHDQQGWASPDTISAKLGYDPKAERDKIRRAQAREEEDRAFEKQRTAAMAPTKKEEVEEEE